MSVFYGPVHFARQFHLNFIIQFRVDHFVFSLKITVSLPFLQVCLRSKADAEASALVLLKFMLSSQIKQ